MMSTDNVLQDVYLSVDYFLTFVSLVSLILNTGFFITMETK